MCLTQDPFSNSDQPGTASDPLIRFIGEAIQLQQKFDFGTRDSAPRRAPGEFPRPQLAN